MKKKLMALMLAVVMVLGLVACGGGKTSDVGKYAGEWNVVGRVSEGEDLTDLISLLGETRLVVAEDGTVETFIMFGEDVFADGDYEVSIKVTDDGAVLDDAGDEYPVEINEEGQLVFDIDGEVFTCEKAEK